jgi:hypothetical protein
LAFPFQCAHIDRSADHVPLRIESYARVCYV